MSFRDLLQAWQNFWFKPQSPLAVSLFRILFGLVMLTHICTQYWQDFHTFFGPNPMIPYDDYIAYWWKKELGINLFEFVPAQDFWHICILVLTAIFTAMMTIGLFTRFSTFLSYLLFCSLDHQYPFFCNAGDNMERLALFLLFFSRAGDGLSLDSFIKNRSKDWRKAVFNPPSSSPWAQRMLQMQLAIAYFSTGLLKINSEYWFSGNGCYIATRLMDFAKFQIPVLLDHRIPLYILCVFAGAVELALGTLIWIKELRYWVILSGVMLHLGIDWLLNIPIFEFVFMSMYVLFVDPEDLQKLGIWFQMFFKRLFRQLSFCFSQSKQA